MTLIRGLCVAYNSKTFVKISIIDKNEKVKPYTFWVDINNPLPMILRIRGEFLRMWLRKRDKESVSEYGVIERQFFLYFEGPNEEHFYVLDEEYDCQCKDKIKVFDLNSRTINGRQEDLILMVLQTYERCRFKWDEQEKDKNKCKTKNADS